MIETIGTEPPRVVSLKLCGKLHDDEDYKQFVQTMQTIFQKLAFFIPPPIALRLARN